MMHCQTVAQDCQASRIFIEFGQLVLAIHLNNELHQVRGLWYPIGFFETLGQHVSCPARTEFVADFVGSANLISGSIVGGDPAAGTVVLRTADGMTVQGVTHGRPVGEKGTLSVRTVHLALTRERPADDVNVWPVKVVRTVFLGDFTQVHVEWGSQSLVVRQIGPWPAGSDGTAYLCVAPGACVLLEATRP